VRPGGSLPAAGTALESVRQANQGQVRLLAAGADLPAEPDLRRWAEAGERSTMLAPMPAGGEVIGVLHLGI